MTRELWRREWKKLHPGLEWVAAYGEVLVDGGSLPPYDQPLAGAFTATPTKDVVRFDSPQLQLQPGDDLLLDGVRYTVTAVPAQPHPHPKDPTRTLVGAQRAVAFAGCCTGAEVRAPPASQFPLLTCPAPAPAHPLAQPGRLKLSKRYHDGGATNPSAATSLVRVCRTEADQRL